MCYWYTHMKCFAHPHKKITFRMQFLNNCNRIIEYEFQFEAYCQSSSILLHLQWWRRREWGTLPLGPKWLRSFEVGEHKAKSFCSENTAGRHLSDRLAWGFLWHLQTSQMTESYDSWNCPQGPRPLACSELHIRFSYVCIHTICLEVNVQHLSFRDTYFIILQTIRAPKL